MKSITISGTIVGPQGEAVTPVWIRAYDGVNELRENAHTTENGSYSIVIPSDTLSVTMRFDTLNPGSNDGFHPELLENISTTGNSVINKQLKFRNSMGFEHHELLQLFGIYERLAFLEFDGEGKIDPDSATTREQIILRYFSMLGQVKHVDEYTERRIEDTKKLIGNLIAE